MHVSSIEDVAACFEGGGDDQGIVERQLVSLRPLNSIVVYLLVHCQDSAIGLGPLKDGTDQRPRQSLLARRDARQLVEDLDTHDTAIEQQVCGATRFQFVPH